MQERNFVAGFKVGEGHTERAWERPLGAESKSPDDNQQKKKMVTLVPQLKKLESANNWKILEVDSFQSLQIRPQSG